MSNLSEQDVHALRQQQDLKAFMAQAMADAKAENARRRALVLRHEDLAAKLTEAPHRFTLPGHWTGYIPPATWNGAANTTPVRPALLALVTEAERRQGAAVGARAAA
ncbi:hypothetical protein ACFWM0_14865 [Streptomyces sp. NPDC058405]|uniref:hypothetical protein n=1 Tax=Streptomyces sp. NPDC058405 TaxID=3346482 RepID=UPI003654681B